MLRSYQVFNFLIVETNNSWSKIFTCLKKQVKSNILKETKPKIDDWGN